MEFVPLLVILFLVPQCLAEKLLSNKVFGQISITAERNRTGFWNQKVLLEHGTQFFRSLSVSVDYHYTMCGKTKELKMTFNVEPNSATMGSLRSWGYWLEGREGLYKFHSEPKTWKEAVDSCREEGAHLAVPNSRQEAEVLLKVASRAESGFYVGIWDQHSDGHYENIFKVPLAESGFSLWSLSEPDPKTSGCVVLESWGYLDSVPCNYTRSFVCEKEMLSAASNYPVGIVKEDGN